MKSEIAYVLQSLEFSMGNDNDNSIQLCFFLVEFKISRFTYNVVKGTLSL